MIHEKKLSMRKVMGDHLMQIHFSRTNWEPCFWFLLSSSECGVVCSRSSALIVVFYRPSHQIHSISIQLFQVNTNGVPILFIGAQKTRQRSLLHHGMPDPLITVDQSAAIGFHGWMPFPEDKRASFSFSLDPNFNQRSSRTR